MQRYLSNILITATLLIVLVACGGTTTTTDPKPTGPKESFKSTATLTASNAAANDEFGNAVAISGDYAIVGVHRNDARARNSGTAYIYKRNGDTWTEIQTLLPSDDSGVNFFGKSVDMLGDYAVVGALSAPAPTSNLAGAAYIYKRNNDSWSEVAKLTSSDAGFVDEFGVSVAMSDTHLPTGQYS